MRKLICGVIATSAMLALTGGAVAQAPEGALNVTASPSKAGTKKKPKSVKLGIDLTVNKPQTTVRYIDLALPKGLKFSGKGFKRCSIATLEAEDGGPSECPRGSSAGSKGSATAVAGTAPLRFTIEPFVLSKTSLVFWVAGDGNSVNAPLVGKITKSGRNMRIEIDAALRQPAPGLDASLTGIQATFSGKRGTNAIVSSTGCTGRKWNVTGKFSFTERADLAPVPSPLTLAATAKCRK